MNPWAGLIVVGLVAIAIAVVFWRSTRIPPSGNDPGGSDPNVN